MKKLGLATVALSVLLLSGCGGSKKKDPMNDKKYVIILTNISSGICESAEYRNRLSLRMGGLLTKETANNTSCGTYGKKNDGNECGQEDAPVNVRGNKNCVVGFDTLDGQGKQTKSVGNNELFNIAEIVANELY